MIAIQWIRNIAAILLREPYEGDELDRDATAFGLYDDTLEWRIASVPLRRDGLQLLFERLSNLIALLAKGRHFTLRAHDILRSSTDPSVPPRRRRRAA